MENLYKMKDILLDSLQEFDTIKGGKLKMGELEAMNRVTDTIKNIDKICMLEEESHSNRGGSYDSMYGHSGRHRVRGHLSRAASGDSYDSGDSYRGGSMRRGRSRDDMLDHLRSMESNARDENERDALRRCIDQIER